MNTPKGIAPIAIILMVVGVLAAAGGIYWWQKTNIITAPAIVPTSSTATSSDQAIGWQIFTDNTHVSFKYPSNWRVEQLEDNPNDFNLQPADKFKSGSQHNNILIMVWSACIYMSSNCSASTTYSLDYIVSYEAGDLGKIIGKANAKNAQGYKVRLGDIYKDTEYIFKKGVYFVIIQSDIYSDVMDKIIPTLQLLVGDTPDLQTYTDKQYSFEIKYPSDWFVFVTQPDEFSLQEDWSKQIGNMAIFQTLPRDVGKSHHYCEFHISTFSNPMNLSLEDYWKKSYSADYKLDAASSVLLSDSNIQAEKFLMEDPTKAPPNDLSAVLVKKNNYIIGMFW